MKFIILAGGTGVRLWPVSRDLYPKQLLNLYDGHSLIQNVYKLVFSLTDTKNILTVTNVRQLNDIKSQLKTICDNPNIIAEPMNKNTLSAIGAALYYLQGKKDETVVILPVDFSIANIDTFKSAIEEAKTIAKKGYIAAIGVKPSYAEDGFGYIQIGEPAKNITPVLKFIEKPDISTAKEYIKSKNYYWNTGIYVSKISVLMKEILKYAPDSVNGFSKEMFDECNKISYEYYEKLHENSIDYAVMEHTKKLAFVELKTKWKDYGSWSEIYNNAKKDAKLNVKQGNVLIDNVSNSLVYSSKELTAASSVKNIIIVDTEDALFVCDKNRTSDINNLVNKIKNKYDETTQIRKTVIRPWGFYTCLNHGEGWLTKIITVYPNHKLSLQSHNYRSEHWVVLNGEATVILENETIFLRKGTSINIPVNAKHSLQNNSKTLLKILEVQKGNYISEEDITRYEDIYGRVV